MYVPYAKVRSGKSAKKSERVVEQVWRSDGTGWSEICTLGSEGEGCIVWILPSGVEHCERIAWWKMRRWSSEGRVLNVAIFFSF